MKNKRLITIITSVIFVIVIVTICLSNMGSAIKDEAKISEFKNSSHLDILVNLGNYSSSEYSDSRLLDVSMQLAEKLGLMDENTDEDNYVQYVSENDLHTIIYELTGHTVEAPIEIEDFYYLYDSENEYYYYRPATPSYYSIKEINSLNVIRRTLWHNLFHRKSRRSWIFYHWKRTCFSYTYARE